LNNSLVTVVDYGIGNLRSVCRALEFSGGSVKLSDRGDEIANAERLVLPGVGAFANCMEELERRNLVEPILDYFGSERPFLGICVGMQMMMEWSEEFGHHRGLGLISGGVDAIPPAGSGMTPYKVPHVGWSPLIQPPEVSWSRTILQDCEEGETVYFVHSYKAVPHSESCRLADCDYYGVRVTAVVQDGNRYGCQFHPEKSGGVGLGIMRCFLAL